MTTLSLFLSGAVLACGALLILSGVAKLYRTTRHAPTTDSAIRTALRINPRRWQRVELAAAVPESATGLAVCTAFHPVISGTALAVLGTTFTSLLAYARHAKASGGCSCIRSSKDPDASIRWPTQARAAWLLAAGIIEATTHLPRPTPTTPSGIAIGLVALITLAFMLAAEGPWPAVRCRLRIPLGPRTTLRTLMNHGVFEAMSNAVGPFAEGFAYHREGCIEEFRFAATPHPGRANRAVAFRVTRTAHSRHLAVEAHIEPALSP